MQSSRLIIVLILVAIAVCAVLLLLPEPSRDTVLVIPTEKMKPRVGGAYLANLNGNPPTFDPALAIDTTSVTCVNQMFDCLVRCDEGKSIRKCLARRWTISPDQKTYTFYLRDDAHFHQKVAGRPTRNGGRLVTAQDVKYSFERVLNPATKSPRGLLFHVIVGARAFERGEAKDVTGIRIKGPHTLEIELTQPFAPFLATLSTPNAAIVPREDVEASGVDFAKRPVGTGPFRFVAFVKDERVLLTANKQYFAGRPYLDSLTFRIIQDEEQQFAEFEKVQLYHCIVPDPKYTYVKKSPRWREHLDEVAQLGTCYFGLNVKIPPFDDVRVRRAFNYAIDKRSIVKHILNGRVLAARGPLPPGIPGYDPMRRDYAYDPDRAATLLDEAGYPIDPKSGLRDSFPMVDLNVDKGSSHARVVKVIQANLADLGIRSRLVERDWEEHLKLAEAGKLAIFRMGWVADYIDADNYLYINFHSENMGRGNGCGYRNEEVDRLLVEARLTVDQEKRERLYRRAEKLIVDDAVWICLYYYSTALVRQPFVRGLNLTPLGEHMLRFEKVWLERTPVPSRRTVD